MRLIDRILANDSIDMDFKEDAEEMKEIMCGLRLQELIQERIDELSPCSTASDEYDEFMTLQSLVEQSEK